MWPLRSLVTRALVGDRVLFLSGTGQRLLDDVGSAEGSPSAPRPHNHHDGADGTEKDSGEGRCDRFHGRAFRCERTASAMRLPTTVCHCTSGWDR